MLARSLSLPPPFTITPPNYRSRGPVISLPNVEVSKDAVNEEVTITIMHQVTPVSAGRSQAEQSPAGRKRWVTCGNLIAIRTLHKPRYNLPS